jgi:hypothetical protein
VQNACLEPVMLSYKHASIFIHGFNHQLGGPRKTMVQGNPARPIATIEIPLRMDVSVKEFAKGLRPIGKKQ